MIFTASVRSPCSFVDPWCWSSGAVSQALYILGPVKSVSGGDTVKGRNLPKSGDIVLYGLCDAKLKTPSDRVRSG
jgi:hypothetical protein